MQDNSTIQSESDVNSNLLSGNDDQTSFYFNRNVQVGYTNTGTTQVCYLIIILILISLSF